MIEKEISQEAQSLKAELYQFQMGKGAVRLPGVHERVKSVQVQRTNGEWTDIRVQPVIITDFNQQGEVVDKHTVLKPAFADVSWMSAEKAYDAQFPVVSDQK